MQKIFLLIVIEQIFIAQMGIWFSVSYLLYFFVVCLMIFLKLLRGTYKKRQKIQLMHFSDKNPTLIKGQFNKKPASCGSGVLLIYNSS
ncbi:hypothetical protein A4R26_30900 [Niastella populi]|uniref:Uncharacterized protein n=1 Tax=Niastella populi TaxID=550983 RepID=A0A1V9ESW7_9BACT|nr:hypothetical protein A4R26_30900 [Niastella populi]